MVFQLTNYCSISRFVFRINFLFFLLLFSACGGSPGDAEHATDSVDISKKFKWKMVTTWPANFPIFQEGAVNFANDVRIMSSGRLDIHVYAGGELVPPLQVFDAVSMGAIEMGHGSPYYWSGKVPEAQFFSTVPFGMTARGMNAWLYYGGGLELWREVYAPYNLIPFPMGNSGMQMGGWFNKKIESMDDIRGLRMRMPGLGGNVLERAGGNPVLMAGSEIYTALERGIIDATEWVGPFHDLRLGLNRAAKYYYYPGWHEPGTMFELIVNSKKWNELPDDLKHIVDIAAAATSEKIYAQMEYSNQAALEQIRNNKNIELLEFPEDVMNELYRLTKITLDEEAAARPAFKKIYEAYSAFDRNYSDWSEISEDSYQRALRESRQ
jgi:TRAP-type mannitol/chloroaromatic compound transport system substrate-binding protein